MVRNTDIIYSRKIFSTYVLLLIKFQHRFHCTSLNIYCLSVIYNNPFISWTFVIESRAYHNTIKNKSYDTKYFHFKTFLNLNIILICTDDFFTLYRYKAIYINYDIRLSVRREVVKPYVSNFSYKNREYIIKLIFKKCIIVIENSC